jgi:predicted TIM-barrel fold metal-dependent hydrolase
VNVNVKPKAFTGIPIIDADTHHAEPYDLWTSRAPAKWKDRVPQVKDVDGKLFWFMDGDKRMGPAFPTCTIAKDGSKAYGMDLTKWGFDDVFEGAHNAKSRVAYMNQAGIGAQICYPNLLGFGNQKGMGSDPELRLVITKIYNDAMAEFQSDSGNRIFPMALLPWWDMKECLAEAERCRGLGFRGVNTHSEPQNNGFPVLGDKHWDPLWDWCEGNDIPLNFHIGGGFSDHEWFGEGFWPTFTSTEKLAYGSSLLFFANFKLFINIFISRWLERFPKLKLVSVESGVGWIPFMLEAVEYQMREAHTDFKVSPTEIFQRQIYACGWFERKHLVEDARRIGIGNVMFQTDFPHPVCLYPDALGYMENAAEGFTPEERRKVFGGNAANVYRIDVDTLG